MSDQQQNKPQQGIPEASIDDVFDPLIEALNEFNPSWDEVGMPMELNDPAARTPFLHNFPTPKRMMRVAKAEAEEQLGTTDTDGTGWAAIKNTWRRSLVPVCVYLAERGVYVSSLAVNPRFRRSQTVSALLEAFEVASKKVS